MRGSYVERNKIAALRSQLMAVGVQLIRASLLRYFVLSPVGHVRCHERLEELPVVRNPKVEQLVDDYEVLEPRFALSKVSG